MSQLPISKHAELRIRKRLGLPKKAVARQVERAIFNGKPPSAFTGGFKRYLDKTAIVHQCRPLVYGGNIFFYRGDVLVTAWPIPSRFRKHLKAER